MKTNTKFVKKGTILQSDGEISHKSYLVKKGLLRSYAIDTKGKEHIFMFAPEGWIIGDMESLAFGNPTELFIDALVDSEVIVYDRDFMELSNLSLELLQEEIKLLARRTAVLQHRILMLISLSALERYEHFIETYPQLINLVPQYMIASYLGITPEALSKLRGEITRNKK